VPWTDTLKSLTALLEPGLQEPRLPPRYPNVAVELAPDGIVGVRLAADRKSGRVTVQHVESRPLPPGAIEPSLTSPNVLMTEPVVHALGEVLSRLAATDHRVSVLIPDHVARVALLSFPTLPRSRRELADLLRFRMAKSLPFKPEEAAVDFMVPGAGASGPGPAGASVLAVFIHRAVLEQYEALFTRAGYWPGLVGLSTFELYNLFRAPLTAHRAGGKDALLLNVTPHYLSLLILSAGSIIFYRCKAHPAGAGAEEGVRAVGRELYTSLAFYQEKLLGRGIERAFLRSTGMPREAVLEVVSREAGCPVELLDPSQVVSLPEAETRDAEAASRVAAVAGAVAGRRA